MDKSVDVSKCEWSRQIDLDINNICTLNSPKKHSGYCKDNPNCVFKQLKCKEQECDRLKHDNDYQVGALEKTIDNLTVENEKLEQTLTEIKEIVEQGVKIHDDIIVSKQILQKISECEGNNEN